MFPGLLPQKTQILLNLDCFISVSFSIFLSLSLSLVFFFLTHRNSFYVPHWTKWISSWWCKRAPMLYIYNGNTCTRPHPITDNEADSHNLYVETDQGDLIQWCVCVLLYHGPLYITKERKEKKKNPEGFNNACLKYTFSQSNKHQ